MRSVAVLLVALLLSCSIAASAVAGSSIISSRQLLQSPARRPQPPPQQRRASKARPPPPRPAPYVLVPVKLSGYSTQKQAAKSAQVLSSLVRSWHVSSRWATWQRCCANKCKPALLDGVVTLVASISIVCMCQTMSSCLASSLPPCPLACLPALPPSTPSPPACPKYAEATATTKAVQPAARVRCRKQKLPALQGLGG